MHPENAHNTPATKTPEIVKLWRTMTVFPPGAMRTEETEDAIKADGFAKYGANGYIGRRGENDTRNWHGRPAGGRGMSVTTGTSGKHSLFSPACRRENHAERRGQKTASGFPTASS
jgi:hypothetical protein